MHKLHRSVLILIAGLLVFPASAYAEAWSCAHDSLNREIEIQRTTSDPAPCQVVYTKATEGADPQILWTAQNDAAYCEHKARGLVEKLQGWGWECTESAEDLTSIDTEMLEKSEELTEDVAEDMVEDMAEDMAEESAKDMTDKAVEDATGN